MTLKLIRRKPAAIAATLAPILILPAASAGAQPGARALAARSPLPQVTISPLRGTPDASPQTQISFLGAPARDLSRIVVVGSRTGRHRGRLRAYATGTGASFLPAARFAPGERVTVHATLSAAGRRTRIATSFAVATPYAISATALPAFPATPSSVLSFASAPRLRPPTVNVTVPGADPALGDIFLTPVYGDSEAGPMIVSPTGGLVWFKPEPEGMQAANLQVQRYLGRKVLTYWQGRIALGHGIGEGVIRDTRYREIAVVHAGNGLQTDMHDFTLGAGGVAYITIYDPVRWNLSAVGGPANGALDDSVVQEIDVRTGLVMFEWHALGHVPLSASHMAPLDDPTAVYDFFHINRIQLLPRGDLLVNARNTWAAYKIDHRTGRILWQLGGRHSTFRLGPDVAFAWQHDTTMLPDGTVQIFDNEDDPEVRSSSRGIIVALDFRTRVATLLRTYVDPDQPVLTASQGDVQALPGGDRLLGFGQVGLVSELSSSGKLTLEMEFAPWVQSYRAFRFPWATTPASRPAVVVTSAAGGGSTQLAASWNGATSVAAWRVLAGASPATLRPLGAATPSAGFETDISVATAARYVAVTALAADGRALATSRPAAVTTPVA